MRSFQFNRAINHSECTKCGARFGIKDLTTAIEFAEELLDADMKEIWICNEKLGSLHAHARGLLLDLRKMKQDKAQE
jgi:hypothetical protein